MSYDRLCTVAHFAPFSPAIAAPYPLRVNKIDIKSTFSIGSIFCIQIGQLTHFDVQRAKKIFLVPYLDP